MNIGDFDIGQNKTFIIAEIGNNHNGDFNRAKLMIDKVVEMGADCEKFQMRQIKEVYRTKSLDKSGEDLGTEYIIDLLNKFELSVEQQKNLTEFFNIMRYVKVIIVCVPIIVIITIFYSNKNIIII